VTIEEQQLEALRAKVALSCRILSRQGIMREVTGHVSARVPGTDDILIRCRSQAGDPGVADTAASAVRRTDLDGRGREVDGYWLPGEFSLHAEIYRSRPEVGAVVHGHPRSSLLCGIMGLELRPIFGAYDPVAMILTRDDVAVYPRSILISSPELGRDLVSTMGGRSASLLTGHGIVTVGRSVEQATVTAIKVETVAEVTLQVAQAGRSAPDISLQDQQILGAMTQQHGVDMPVNQWTFDLYARALGENTAP
jgi:ribulose-5-phosphate 4-epimerase/fuculose-1-phosphate aldolase